MKCDNKVRLFKEILIQDATFYSNSTAVKGANLNMLKLDNISPVVDFYDDLK